MKQKEKLNKGKKQNKQSEKDESKVEVYQGSACTWFISFSKVVTQCTDAASPGKLRSFHDFLKTELPSFETNFPGHSVEYDGTLAAKFT